MLTRLSCALAATLVFASCSPAPASSDKASVAPETVNLDLVWRLGGLANPESAALSEDGSFLYVTNVNGEGEAVDGNGFISKVATNGAMLAREWATGFDGPKGIARDGDVLYVADITQLVTVSADTGEILARTPLAGATFLNDVAVAPDGRVLVADSQGQRIYAVSAGQPSTWIENDLLRSVNGLLPDGDRLLVTTMSGRLLAVDYATSGITVLAEGLGDGDGVATLADGRYLVSEWPGLMHVVGADGAHTTILDTKAEGRLLNDFLLVGTTLFQPHWDPGEISAYRVSLGAP